MSTDAFEIEALDQPTFTQVGHWVAFRSDLSPTARHLYTVLATFVNQGRRANGDTSVWPSLNLLAVTLGVSKGDSVTPYIDELIQANIVVKTSNTIGGMKSRNTYAIRFNPPPETKVVTSFVELLEPLKAIAGDPKAMSKAAKATRALIKERRERESAPRSTGKTEAGPVPRNTGVRAPESRGAHPAIPGSNKTQGELDGGRTTPSSSSAGAPAEPRQGEGAPKKTRKTESPEQIIERRLGCTPEEAGKVATLINQQGDGKGGRIRSLSWWVENRDLHTLRQDLAIVRGSQSPAGVPKPLDEGERIRRMQKGGYQPYKNPVDQDVYDEPLLPVPEKAHTGARAPVPDNEYWDTVSDEDLKNSFL
ncbi:hypothetical protein [Nocardiopsis eucommiae]|uniref:hypothetical protein n=1 Tax=Nocardiopsis eucommiae TaxID=2831970 RepID=UPI003D75C7C9